LVKFFKLRKKKSSVDSDQIEQVSISMQSRLDTIRPTPQQAQRAELVSEVSAKQLESDVESYVKDFQLYVKRVKETSLGLKELSKLVKSGDVSEAAYKIIMNDLGAQLALSIENIFQIREALELTRAKAKLEWAKEKVSLPAPQPSSRPGLEFKEPVNVQNVRTYSDVIQSDYFSNETSNLTTYHMSLARWDDIISKIDSVLNSLPIEDEAAIVEQYLSIIHEKLSLGSKSVDVENGISVCKQRLDSISERWSSMRRSQIEKIMNLELEVSQLNDEIKELEVRYSVDEIAQKVYETKMSVMQTDLKKAEKKISDVRTFIDDMDMKIFRCSELMREAK
jgi:hypothetical protein